MSQIQRKIQVNGHLLNYYLSYRPQKNIILRIREGKIYITAPNHAQEWEIEQIIYQNYARINKIQNNYEVHSKYDLYGLKPWIKLFDQNFEIILIYETIQPRIIEKTVFIHNYFNVEEQLTKLYAFLGEKYKIWFQNRVLQWANQMGVTFKTLTLRVMKMKWGACYPKGQRIVLNTKLIHFSPRTIDYVIIHELAHLIYPNHSKEFWDLIAKTLPKYQEYKADLDFSGI